LQSSYSAETSTRPSGSQIGLGEEDARQEQPLRRPAEHAHQIARPVLLHLEVLQRDIQGAGLDETFHQVVEVLGHQVVEVRLEEADAVRSRSSAAAEHGPQHVGHRARTLVARAVSHRLHRHGRQRAVALHQRVQDRRPRRRHRLPVDVGGHRGDAAQQLEGGRRGKRQPPVLAIHAALSAQRHRRGADAFDPQARQADGSAGHVDDRVDGAELVEVDLLEGDAVDPRLGTTQRLEHGERPLAHGGVEPRLAQELHDLAEGAPAPAPGGGCWARAPPREPDLHVARGQRAPHHPPHPQRELQSQARQIGFELLAREPQVEERTQDHVSGDAREDVEVQDPRAARAG
jgi:hypothetical protein